MLKKIFLIILSFSLLSNCEYKPVYSYQNNLDYKIVITNFTGDMEINNLIVLNLKRNSKDNSNEIINISFSTKYSKNVLAKNATGAITDYQTNAETSFIITKGDSSESFKVNEKFNFQKITDKYEEKNYEQNIKKNLAISISQKLITRLAMIK